MWLWLWLQLQLQLQLLSYSFAGSLRMLGINMLQKFCFYKNTTFITCLLLSHPELQQLAAYVLFAPWRKIISPEAAYSLCLHAEHAAKFACAALRHMQSIPPQSGVMPCVLRGCRHEDTRSLRSRLRGFAAPLGDTVTAFNRSDYFSPSAELCFISQKLSGKKCKLPARQWL